MGSLLRLWGLSLVLITPIACGDDSDEGKTTPPPPPTRSAACTAFQDAACARGERCGRVSGADCYAALRSTFCTSDAAALSCADELDQSQCTDTIPCGETVLDPSPAIEICNEFLSTACDWVTRCDSTTTLEACRAEFEQSYNCANAVGIEGDHQPCIDALQSAACSAEPALLRRARASSR